MIAKKNKNADLEKKRFAFFQIGLLVSGSLCLAAFEYSSVNIETAYTPPLEQESTSYYAESLPEDINLEPEKKKEVATKIIIMTPEIIIVDEVPPVGEIKIEDETIIIVDEQTGGGNNNEFKIIEPPIIYPTSQTEPQFIGGDAAMAKFINENIDLPNYIPEYDEGTIYVQFVVNQDGSIEQTKILQGTSPELNKAAKEVVEKMPKWIPGENAGKKVRVMFTVPIRIILH